MKRAAFIRILCKNWLPVLALTLSLGAAVWFGGSVVREILYFNDPAHQDQDLKPWMTPRYVGLSYQLPPPVIDQIFDIDRGDGKHLRMRDIARTQQMSLTELTAFVRAQATAFRAQEQQK